LVRLAQRINRHLRCRGDLHREAGQHTDRVAGADARGGQAAGDAPSAFVHLAPRVADGFVRFHL